MILKVKGMHCKSCKLLVEDIMEDLNVKVNSLEVDEENKIGTLDIDTANVAKVKNAIKEEAGYEVE